MVPVGYDGGSAVPMVVLLHGYGATGVIQDQYFQFSQLANAKTFLLATPDGTTDAMPKQFWNATDACCNFYGSTVDDVKYLTAILDEAALKYRVDAKRVFVVGHSNGGFMAHRFACDRAARVAAIVSLAGVTWKNPAQCQPSGPVAVLQVHGTSDDTIAFDGGSFGGPSYPGAKETIAQWAQLNGCATTLAPGGTALDLVTNLAGAETKRSAHSCTAGAAELWTIEGGPHIPSFGSTWATEVWTFLHAHPKP